MALYVATRTEIEMTDENRILTRREAARRIGLSERTLDRLCATDAGLRKIQISTRRVGISAADVTAYLERATQATS
jgi:predicted DNA-binding transcriptional regulator AlpA